jgi:hypothetical protein
MVVWVQDAAERVASSYVEPGDPALRELPKGQRVGPRPLCEPDPAPESAAVAGGRA